MGGIIENMLLYREGLFSFVGGFEFIEYFSIFIRNMYCKLVLQV